MAYDPEEITYFAETDFRNQRKPFGIKAKDREQHMYTIGKTGMGKSTMLENMAIQDIQNGNGMGFIDPHGSAVDKLIDYVPEERIKDVIYFAPFDTENPVSFNVLEDVGKGKRNLAANGLMSVFKKLWADQWSARMEYFLINTLLALLEYPGATIMDINRMLVNKDFRKDVVAKVTDPAVKSFWLDEFTTYTDTYAREATPAIQNKIGQFVSNPIIRNIVGQPQSSFDVREVIDNKKIFLMNLSKGRIGEENAKLIGGMLVVKIYLAALSRAELSAAELQTKPPFYFFVDEFQSFANESFADILSEARKYKLSLAIAHQYVEQMPETVRDAVFGNVGTMAVFRVGSFDAEVFEKEFAPQFTAEDIVNLDFRQIYLKLMIDGVASRPFSAVTIPPIEPPEVSFREDVIASSRKQFARSQKEVEESVEKRMTEFPMQERSKEEDARARFKPGGASRFGGKQHDTSDSKAVESPRRNQDNTRMRANAPSTTKGAGYGTNKKSDGQGKRDSGPARAPSASRGLPRAESREGRPNSTERKSPQRVSHPAHPAPSQKEQYPKPRPTKNPDNLPSEQSRNQLRDALAAALKERQPTTHNPQPTTDPSTMQAATGHGANDTNSKENVYVGTGQRSGKEQETFKQENQHKPTPPKEPEESTDKSRERRKDLPRAESKEVPEETLRKMLD